MNAYIAWAIISISLFTLIGLAVYFGHSLYPLWLAILPFCITIKKSGGE